jgi:signal transduction histidine kinase
MSNLCDALLTFARAEVTADAAENMDAATVADARVAIWGQAARRAGIRLARAGDAVAPVRVAVQALDQALDALISNAVKFAGAGATVVVSVHRAGPDWVDIDVVDDGPGMSAEGLRRAAEPFWRAPDRSEIDGSGLGVTIADALVRASGGRLDLFAARPQGVHARIRLPAPRRTVPAPRTGRLSAVKISRSAGGVRT